MTSFARTCSWHHNGGFRLVYQIIFLLQFAGIVLVISKKSQRCFWDKATHPLCHKIVKISPSISFQINYPKKKWRAKDVMDKRVQHLTVYDFRLSLRKRKKRKLHVRGLRCILCFSIADWLVVEIDTFCVGKLITRLFAAIFVDILCAIIAISRIILRIAFHLRRWPLGRHFLDRASRLLNPFSTDNRVRAFWERLQLIHLECWKFSRVLILQIWK
mmetsp:Transcript_9046/g.16388  ORF Transcript_9046/g.16388 Transcript_9046/m.16388 type:complete len:216 (+) Transcript_9046:1070-1717(+)